MDNNTDEFHTFSLLGGYNNGGGGYAAADFADAEDTQPAAAYMEALGGNSDAVQGIVQQTLLRHSQELLPQTSPRLTSGNWRKTLREMMIKQNESLISFLFRPAQDHSVAGPVEKALRRFAIRHDVEPAAIVPLKDLLQDSSGVQMIREEIEQRIRAKGPSNLQELRAQATTLFDMYKEVGEQINTLEAQLKTELEKMDKVQRRVGIVMELKQNEATGELMRALEHYLQACFRGAGIEQQYKTLLRLYQKHFELREAIQLLRISQSFSEPVCPICVVEPVSRAIIPCGHTFCQGCATRLVGQCGICRGPIRDRMKIYFT